MRLNYAKEKAVDHVMSEVINKIYEEGKKSFEKTEKGKLIKKLRAKHAALGRELEMLQPEYFIYIPNVGNRHIDSETKAKYDKLMKLKEDFLTELTFARKDEYAVFQRFVEALKQV